MNAEKVGQASVDLVLSAYSASIRVLLLSDCWYALRHTDSTSRNNREVTLPPGISLNLRPAWQARRGVDLALIIGFLVLVYSPTLLTTINGSSEDLMADVGESQVVLNTWGTLHATGYPLFVILGNLIVSALKPIGVAAAAAPTFVAALWGFAALGLIYLLICRLTGRALLAVAATILFGLTRLVWLHNVIPEVYSFALFLFVLLLLLAVREGEFPHRLEWLALVGGIAVAHHRALVLALPPVLYAVWSQFASEVRRRPHLIVVLLLLGIVGFVPYLYLPLRAWTGATWVYGEPGTLGGLWDQIIARENPTILLLPDSLTALATKFQTVNAALVTELSLPGLLVGIAGLALALRARRRRRAAVIFLISAVTAYLFDGLVFNDLLAPTIFPITLSLVTGWAMIADSLLSHVDLRRYAYLGLVPITAGCAGWLISQNYTFINNLTHDETGLRTIALAERAPAGSTLVLDWGTQYFAVGFAQDVLGQLQGIRRAEAHADLTQLLTFGPLVTPDYTFFQHPVRWWRERLGQRVYLRAVAPHLVQVDTTPEHLPPGIQVTGVEESSGVLVIPIRHQVRCAGDTINLSVDWYAAAKPSRNLSVFVHLLNASGEMVSQADESAPVYGWRPLTDWEAGEVVRDIYPLPRRKDATLIRFGFYERLTSGEFANYSPVTVPTQCE